MTEPDRASQEAFCHPIIEDLQPEGPTERQLAQVYAALQWRINRLAAIEENVFTLGRLDNLAGNLNLDHPEVHDALSQAKTFLRDAASFSTLSIYGHRLINQADKIMSQLAYLQSDRQAAQASDRRKQDEQAEAHERELGEAISVFKVRQAQRLPFDPQAFGFVCSIDEIRARIARDGRRSQALDDAQNTLHATPRAAAQAKTAA
jgi:hypothetical protein